MFTLAVSRNISLNLCRSLNSSNECNSFSSWVNETLKPAIAGESATLKNGKSHGISASLLVASLGWIPASSFQCKYWAMFTQRWDQADSQQEPKLAHTLHSKSLWMWWKDLYLLGFVHLIQAGNQIRKQEHTEKTLEGSEQLSDFSAQFSCKKN